MLFENLCRRLGVAVERIATSAAAGERSPDYRVELSGGDIVVEVKQFDPNPEEQAVAVARAAGKVVVGGGTPGARIRKAIQKAVPQLKALSAGVLPAMLVVFDRTGVPIHTDTYSVATAIRGFDVIPVQVAEDPSVRPRFGAPRSGPKRKLTPVHNTTISAVAVLFEDADRKPGLVVYHNPFARIPIDPAWLQHPAVTQWRLRTQARSSLDDPWERV